MKPRTKRAKDMHEDCHGVRFDEVRLILGEDKFRWPQVRRVKNPRVPAIFHEMHGRCWKSGAANPEAHHMASGYCRGKSDELCALAALSPEWHGVVNTNALPLGHLLYLKWANDLENCDWVRLTLLFGYFLPDLQAKG